MNYKQVINHVLNIPCYFELPVVETPKPYIRVEGQATKTSIWLGEFTLNLYHDSDDLETPNALLNMGKINYVDGLDWAHGSINQVNETISDELNSSLTKYNMILRGN